MNTPEQNVTPTFSPQQMNVFQTLRSRYEEDHDQFTDRERHVFGFLRWLLENGHFDSTTIDPEAGCVLERPIASDNQAGDLQA